MEFIDAQARAPDGRGGKGSSLRGPKSEDKNRNLTREPTIPPSVRPRWRLGSTHIASNIARPPSATFAASAEEGTVKDLEPVLQVIDVTKLLIALGDNTEHLWCQPFAGDIRARGQFFFICNTASEEPRSASDAHRAANSESKVAQSVEATDRENEGKTWPLSHF